MGTDKSMAERELEDQVNSALGGVSADPTIIHRHSQMQNGVKEDGVTPFSARGYEDLARILSGAFDQSAYGKGHQRHSDGNLPFKDQKIMALARLSGIDAHTYQISKKALEAGGMFKRSQLEAAIHEFRGVIIYAAAAILLAEERLNSGPKTN